MTGEPQKPPDSTANVTGSPVIGSTDWLGDLRFELETIIDLAEWGIANERLGGNCVKEEHWKGQRFAATQIMQWLDARSPNDQAHPTAAEREVERKKDSQI